VARHAEAVERSQAEQIQVYFADEPIERLRAFEPEFDETL
jgi:hypothetical protein